MKKLNKKTIIAVFGGMLVAAGSYLTYLQAQPQEQMSDLTLANLEAMANDLDNPDLFRITYRCRGEGDLFCLKTEGTAGTVIEKTKQL